MALETETKPAIKSAGIWGSTASIVAFVTAIVVAKTGIPVEYVGPLVEVLAGGALASVVSLFGRLNAQFEIKGLFK